MSYLIAVTGKGGAGKTTLSALLIWRLAVRGKAPVLAVDADPNTCLDAALGLRVEKTVGRIREEAREASRKGLSSGISKQQLLELKIAESLVEADNFDLIAMGRPEGPGCYCYANNVLSSILRQISAEYPYVVLDNEAGLENLSRRIVQKVDLLILVTDPSQRGLETVVRLHALANEMKIVYARLAIVVNRLRHHSAVPEVLHQLRQKVSADFVVPLAEDDQLAAFGESGANLMKLPTDNAVVARIDEFLLQLGL
ncbi:MAG: AAA family ATPase [Candidatus Zhuqueibacterota bacterium]